jgi:hypothetical protein
MRVRAPRPALLSSPATEALDRLHPSPSSFGGMKAWTVLGLVGPMTLGAALVGCGEDDQAARVEGWLTGPNSGQASGTAGNLVIGLPSPDPFTQSLSPEPSKYCG